MKLPRITELFDLSKTITARFLRRYKYPWEAIPNISDYVLELGPKLDKKIYRERYPGIWIARNADIYENCFILPPCIIGERAVLRSSAFIRGGVIIGNDCVIGNSSELKNCIIFNEAQVPHFNYVGDSILGYRSHLGAGAITSNVKSDKTPISVQTPRGKVDTGLKKLGAMVGDYAEVGCNAVLNPGTILYRNSSVYPLSSVRGFVPEGSIYKKQGEIVERV